MEPSSPVTRTRRIKLKCRCNEELRNVILLPEHSFSHLKKRLSLDYGFKVSLKYEDADGDLIILSSQVRVRVRVIVRMRIRVMFRFNINLNPHSCPYPNPNPNYTLLTGAIFSFT
jgi:hypothetical protein